MAINLDNPDILGATEAAEIWGKNKAYVRNSIRQNPEKWPAGTHRVFGQQLVVTTEGMESATGMIDPRKQRG